MWRSLSILLWLIIWPFVISAQKEDLELVVLNDSILRFSPGITFNLAVKLMNHTNHDEQVSFKLKLPEGWRCFSNLNQINAENLRSTFKILSFKTPSNALSGNYKIGVEVWNSGSKKSDELQIPVTIFPKYALNVAISERSEYLFAGDSLIVQFKVQNHSNIKAKIKTLLRAAGADEEMSFELMPDSDKLITKKMVTEKGIVMSVRRNISLNSTIVGNEEVNASETFFYNLIPSPDSRAKTWDRIPLNVSTLFVSDNPGRKRMAALMADISAGGFIDDKNTKYLLFHMRGPDRRGKPLYGINDEYSFEYRTKRWKYLIGDNIYSLSYLTEFSRYARGGSAEYSFNHFSIGSFINFPRFYPKIRQEASLYAGFNFPSKLAINLGYLNKLINTGQVNNLVTLNGFVSPVKWMKADWEYSAGLSENKKDQAVRAALAFNSKPVHLNFNFTEAGKDFPGYFSDTRYVLITGSLFISSRINFSTSISDNHQNVARDTLYGSSPFSKQIFLSLNYLSGKNGGLSVGYNYRSQQDRMTAMKFNFNENTLRLNLNRRFGKLGFNLTGEYGTTENLLLAETQKKNSLYRAQFSTTGSVFKNLNFSSFINYQQSKSFITKDYKNWVYGISANGSVSKKLLISIQYQSSYNRELYLSDRSLLNGVLMYKPNVKNSFEASGRYNLAKNSLTAKELAFSVRYVRTFNMPVSKKKNIGKLSGSIIDKGVKTVAGLVVSVGSYQAVTDKKGNFSFPVLQTGHYYIMINYQSAGLYAIPETPGPYEVDILPGQETKFDITLTVAARITGITSVVKEISDDDKSFAGVKDKLGKLLIEAKKGDELFRIFTKEDGKFSFESLRPGEWTIKVYKNGIPDEYELVTEVFNINLEPGQTQNLEVKLKEIRRKIKFQKTFSQVTGK